MKVFQTSRKSPSGIMITILCAITTYCITYYVLNDNIIQYADLPKTLSVKVHEGSSADTAAYKYFNLKVESKLKIDAKDSVNIKPGSKAGGKPSVHDLLFHQNPV